MPPAVLTVPPPHGGRQPRCINERSHLPASFMEKHTSLGGGCSLRVKETAATGEGQGRRGGRNNGSQHSRHEVRALICILHLHLRGAAVIPSADPYSSMNGNAAKTFKSSRPSRRIIRYYCAPPPPMVEIIAHSLFLSL